MSSVSKRVTRSLKVKVTVAVSPAVRRSSLIVTVTSGSLSTSGGLVSMLKLPLLPLPSPAPSVGPPRRQSARRAFPGVVLNVVEIAAGDALAEGEGDGGGFASGQALAAERHRDPGQPVDHGRPGVDAEVGAADAARSGGALRVQDAVEVHVEPVEGAFGVGPGRVGGCPDLAVGAHRRQRAQRALAGVVLDVLGTKAGDALAEGDGDGGGFSS